MTRNLPKTEVKRLKKMGKGDYFKARIVLRDDGRYWLESALMETASQLAKFAKFAKPLFELSNGKKVVSRLHLIHSRNVRIRVNTR